MPLCSLTKYRSKKESSRIIRLRLIPLPGFKRTDKEPSYIESHSRLLMGYALCDSELGLRTIQQNPSTTSLVSHLHSFQGIPRKLWLKVQIQILPSLFNSLCHLFLLKLPHPIPIPSGINPYFYDYSYILLDISHYTEITYG